MRVALFTSGFPVAAVVLSCMACARSNARVIETPSPAASPAMTFRWLEDSDPQRVALLACPAGLHEACQRLATYDAISNEHAGQAVPSPNRQRLAVQRVDARGGCIVELFDLDGRLSSHDNAPGCNANNGDMLWIDDDRLWVGGGAGTSVAFASLVSAGGTTLWSTVDIAIELAPSGRYVLVGSSSRGGASIDTVSLIDLTVPGGAALATVPVPDGAGNELAARWERDRVLLTSPGSRSKAITVMAPGASRTPEDTNLVGHWRPFATE